MELKTFEIIKNSKKFISISLAGIAILLAIMIVNIATGKGAFNLDVEFSGGTAIVVNAGEDVSADKILEIEDYIKENTEESNPVVRNYEDSNYIEIKIQETDSVVVGELTTGLLEHYNLTNEDLISTSSFSSTVSNEMKSSALLAIIVACIAITIYVGIRFKDFTMGVSAIIALLHDVTFVVLFYSATRIPLNYSFIAVLLTVVGYSINATIVIFDRARENKKLRPSMDEGELMNMSINQTITRSIYTSATTLLAILFLFVFGVDSMKQFSLPIMFGVAIGTYSSICISGSVWYNLRGKKKAKQEAEQEAEKSISTKSTAKKA